MDAFKRFEARYEKLSSSLEKLITGLERTRMGLLKDLTVLDKMYELNLEYLRQLDLYIAAGDETLEELNTKRLPAMEAGAKASQDPMVAQQLADFRQAALRFERRLHDLKLTRTIAIQTAPQIRLIEANNQGLVEKIQTLGDQHHPPVEEPDHHRPQPLPPAAGPSPAEGRHRHDERAAREERRDAPDGFGRGGPRD